MENIFCNVAMLVFIVILVTVMGGWLRLLLQGLTFDLTDGRTDDPINLFKKDKEKLLRTKLEHLTMKYIKDPTPENKMNKELISAIIDKIEDKRNNLIFTKKDKLFTERYVKELAALQSEGVLDDEDIAKLRGL